MVLESTCKKSRTPAVGLGVSSWHRRWESPNKPLQAEAGLNHALITPWSDNALRDRAGLGPVLWGSRANARDSAGSTRAGSSSHPTRLPRRDRHHLLHSRHPSRAGRAAVGPVCPCRCSPAGVTLGHQGAGCLQPPSPFPAHPFSPLLSAPFLLPSATWGQKLRAGGKGQEGDGGGGTARGRNGAGWAAGSDGEVRLPLLFLRQVLAWLDVVVLDEAVVILSLQVGSTGHGVALTGPPE